MADVYAVNYGTGALGANANKFKINTSDAGRELVVKVAGTNLTDENLLAVMRYLTLAHGSAGTGDSAFTVAAFGTADGTPFVSGETDTVFFRLQGTGDFTPSVANQEIAGVTVSIEAIFRPAL